VAISAVIALTLSPMMCSRMFKAAQQEGHLARMIDHNMGVTRSIYQFFLRFVLDSWRVVVVFGLIIIALIFVLVKFSQRELAPSEDQGITGNIPTGTPNTTPQQMELYSRQVYHITSQLDEFEHIVQFDGFNGVLNRGFAPLIMKPWSERHRKAQEISQELRK